MKSSQVDVQRFFTLLLMICFMCVYYRPSIIACHVFYRDVSGRLVLLLLTNRLLTFILIIISIPSPPHSFIPGLKPPFSPNPSHRSLPFLLRD